MKRLFCILLALILALSCFALGEEAAPEYRDLRKGSESKAVKQLQKRLRELGFFSMKVDGEYDNGTVRAIEAFETYNGLEPTGLATAELQAFLFSEEAIGLEIPDIEISSVGMKKSYGYYNLRPTFVNNTEHTIKSITYMLKAYNAAGERLGSFSTMSLSDVIYYEGSDDFQKVNATGEVNKLQIKPGKKYSVGSSKQIDLYAFENSMIDTVYIAITRYVTDDGAVINIPENDQIWYGSDGKIVTVEYENNLLFESSLQPSSALTLEIEEYADSFQLGIDCAYISNFCAEAVGLPVGGVYVSYVYDESPAKDAGLKEGDILVKIGDAWVFDNISLLLAKGAMEPQEPEPIVFYRRGQRIESEIELL